jgi:hypothetical protein
MNNEVKFYIKIKGKKILFDTFFKNHLIKLKDIKNYKEKLCRE